MYENIETTNIVTSSLSFNLFVVTIFSQSPRSYHKVAEVVVVVNAGWDSSIVVVPLSPSDFTVTTLVAEAGQEFNEDVVAGHLTAADFGVLGGIVHDSEVTAVDQTGAVVVEFSESSVDNFLTCGVGVPTEAGKEFVKVDHAILVGVHGV